MKTDLTLFDYVADGICVLDKDLRVVFWNKSLESLLSMDRKSITGKILTRVYPSINRPVITARLDQVLYTGTPVIFSNQLHGNLFPTPKDHREVIQHIVVTGLPTGKKESFYAVLNVKDISELSKKIAEYKTARKEALKEIENRKKIEEDLKNTIMEKEFLIREVYHRVKNNLALIGSIIKLQQGQETSNSIDDILGDLYNRISSISLIHEKLYKSSQMEYIEIRDYLTVIVSDIINSMTDKPALINVSFRIDKTLLIPEKAIAIGLITTEAVTNSLKYGLASTGKGDIAIQLTKQADKKYLLEISDSGPGFPKDLNPETHDSLGFKVINALTLQLDGTHTINREKGAMHRITFALKGETL